MLFLNRESAQSTRRKSLKIVARGLTKLGKSHFRMELHDLSRFKSQRALPAGHCTLALGPLRTDQRPSTLQLLKPALTVDGAGEGGGWSTELLPVSWSDLHL